MEYIDDFGFHARQLYVPPSIILKFSIYLKLFVLIRKFKYIRKYIVFYSECWSKIDPPSGFGPNLETCHPPSEFWPNLDAILQNHPSPIMTSEWSLRL